MGLFCKFWSDWWIRGGVLFYIVFLFIFLNWLIVLFYFLRENLLLNKVVVMGYMGLEGI